MRGCVDGEWSAKHAGESVDGGDGTKPGCAQDAHDDRLGVSAIECAVAGKSFD